MRGLTEQRSRLFADTLDHVRGLRRRSTDAEARLWYQLRSRRLAGAKFRRQCPVGPYILDYCPESKLVIELDGGGHAEPEQEARDEQRREDLQRLGMTVLRVWNTDVLLNTAGVLEQITEALSPPSP